MTLFQDILYRSAMPGVLIGAALTLTLLLLLMDKLPTDIGRAYAVNAFLAMGKPRGAGIIMISVFTAVSLGAYVFEFLTSESSPVSSFGSKLTEPLIMLLVLLAMVTGYLDDASRTPWSELKKGLFDLFISVACAVICAFDRMGTVTLLSGRSITLPLWLYIILGTLLVWVSINVTNCTDGVDGLCSSLSIVSLIGFIALGRMTGSSCLCSEAAILAGCLGAYLLLNAGPSMMLMGDAGSRAIGVFFGAIAMMSDGPFMYIPLCLIFIVDGGLGLIKVALLRYLRIRILKNTRTPLHDHFRKNLGWSDTHVVMRALVIHSLIISVSLWLFTVL